MPRNGDLCAVSPTGHARNLPAAREVSTPLPMRSSESEGWRVLFEAAFKDSASPMLLLTSDHVFVDINDACATTFMRSRDELVGQLADPLIAPSSQAALAEVWRLLARRSRVARNLDWIRGDGVTVHVQFAALTAIVRGRPLILCVVLDTRLHPLELPAGQNNGEAALTPREIEVVSQVAMGKRIHEIAEDLVISPATARTHMRNAMRKLGARSQAQLVAIVLIEGLLDPRACAGL
jgi:PAS domain S-box-containing protein